MAPSPAPKPRSLFPRRRGAAPRVTACGCGGTAQTAGILPQIIGPEATKDYMRRVHVAYATFDGDVDRDKWGRNALPADFYKSWKSQWLAWAKFYDDHINGVTTGWSTSEYDQTESYEIALKGYREQFAEYTGRKPTGPDPVVNPPSVDPAGTLGGLANVLKWGAIGYIAIKVAQAVGDRKK